MARPSDGWDGFGHLDEDSNQRERMQNLLSTAKFEFLESQAIIARARQHKDLPSTITCSIDPSQFTWGFNNIVFEVAFSDGIYWIARVQHAFANSNDTEDYVSTMSEISTMNLIRSRTTIPVPQVFDYSLSPDNPFGYPYMLTEYLSGHPCQNTLARTVPSKYRPKVAEQLANVFFELQSLTFDRIGRLWTRGDGDFELIPPEAPNGASSSLLDTSLEFFYAKREMENREIVQSTHPNDADWLTACWVLKIALGHMILDDRRRGPFPLCHLDLHYGNLLFDNEFNLTGVLDWSNAQTAPMERLAVCPEFITFPALSDEENRPIIEFKQLVIQYLREKEEGSRTSEGNDSTSPLTSLSDFLQSDRAELAYLCTYSNSRRALWDAKRAAKLMYDKTISWEQLKKVYETMPVI